jgi:hypothetical protein
MESSSSENASISYEYEDAQHNFYDFAECITRIHFAYPEMPYNQRLVSALQEYENWSVSIEKLILINKLSQVWIDKAMEYINSTQLVVSDLSFSDTRIHTFNCCDRCEDNESFHKEELIEHKLRELNEQNAQNEVVLDEVYSQNEDAQNEVASANANDYKFNKKNNDFNIVNKVQKKENKNKKKKEIKNKTEVKVNMHKQLNKLGKKLATQFALNKISHLNFQVDDVDVELGDVSKENHVVFSKPTKQQRRIMDKSRHRERNNKMTF